MIHVIQVSLVTKKLKFSSFIKILVYWPTHCALSPGQIVTIFVILKPLPKNKITKTMIIFLVLHKLNWMKSSVEHWEWKNVVFSQRRGDAQLCNKTKKLFICFFWKKKTKASKIVFFRFVSLGKLTMTLSFIIWICKCYNDLTTCGVNK